MTNIRGKTLAQVIAIAAASFDERSEQAINDAANIVRDNGGTDDEIEAMCNLQREILAQDREAQLTELRAWLKRGGEPLQ